MHTYFRLCLRFSDAAYGWYVYACFLTQTSSPRFPSQTLRFSGFMSKAPSIQWRDRAGFAPASILAFYPAARKTPAGKPAGFPLQSAEKKEHKSSSVFSFSKKYFIIKMRFSQAPSRYFSAFMSSPFVNGKPIWNFWMSCFRGLIHFLKSAKRKRNLKY